jgi:hypothetical protein
MMVAPAQAIVSKVHTQASNLAQLVIQMVRLYQLIQSGNCETRLMVMAMAGSLWSLAMQLLDR